jgi:hypothetical protein
MQVINKLPTYTYEYLNSTVAMYHANKGEGLPRHEHIFAHMSMCCSGRIAVRKENVYVEMDQNHVPVLLKEREWHEIEALEDNTIFINILPRV